MISLKSLILFASLVSIALCDMNSPAYRQELAQKAVSGRITIHLSAFPIIRFISPSINVDEAAIKLIQDRLAVGWRITSISKQDNDIIVEMDDGKPLVGWK